MRPTVRVIANASERDSGTIMSSMAGSPRSFNTTGTSVMDPSEKSWLLMCSEVDDLVDFFDGATALHEFEAPEAAEITESSETVEPESSIHSEEPTTATRGRHKYAIQKSYKQHNMSLLIW